MRCGVRETCWDCWRGQTNSFRLGEVAIRCVGGVLGGGEDVLATRFDWTYISGGVECSASTSVCRGAECVRFPRCRARVCNTSVGRFGGLVDFRQCVLRPPFGKSRGTDKGKRILSVQQKTEVLERNVTTTDMLSHIVAFLTLEQHTAEASYLAER